MPKRDPSKVKRPKVELALAGTTGAEVVTGLLRPLVDNYQQMQKLRIAFGNRTSALEAGGDTDTIYQVALEISTRYEERFRALEKEFAQDVAYIVRYLPIFEPLSKIAGIGPLLAAKLIATFSIQKANTVSAFWRFSGYGLSEYWVDEAGKVQAPIQGYRWVKNGDGPKSKVFAMAEAQTDWHKELLRDRLVGGWCATYSQRAKTLMHIIGTSFLKARGGSPYADLYRTRWMQYVRTRPDWGKCATCKVPLMQCQQPMLHQSKDFRGPGKGWQTAHIHLAALRLPIKVFLSHLWNYWRTLEDLPVRPLYVHEKLEHTMVYHPEQFGWPPLSSVARVKADPTAPVSPELVDVLMREAGDFQATWGEIYDGPDLTSAIGPVDQEDLNY